MRDLVNELCSPACAGRSPGTPGGIRARGLVRDALRDAGLDPAEQPSESRTARTLSRRGPSGRLPFLFLTCGRSARYHTPADTPEHLDWPKMQRTAAWLERLVRRACVRPEERVVFAADARDDRSSLVSIVDLLTPLASLSPLADGALSNAVNARSLLDACDAEGKLPAELAEMPAQLVHGIERALQ